MSLPQPFPGLVIRYNYLWADDAAQGREEGEKDRPAAIVMAVKHSGETHVYALPITHSAPMTGTEALEIRRRSAGLLVLMPRGPGSCYPNSMNSCGLASICGSFRAVRLARWRMGSCPPILREDAGLLARA